MATQGALGVSLSTLLLADLKRLDEMAALFVQTMNVVVDARACVHRGEVLLFLLDDLMIIEVSVG